MFNCHLDFILFASRGVAWVTSITRADNSFYLFSHTGISLDGALQRNRKILWMVGVPQVSDVDDRIWNDIC